MRCAAIRLKPILASLGLTILVSACGGSGGGVSPPAGLTGGIVGMGQWGLVLTVGGGGATNVIGDGFSLEDDERAVFLWCPSSGRAEKIWTKRTTFRNEILGKTVNGRIYVAIPYDAALEVAEISAATGKSVSFSYQPTQDPPNTTRLALVDDTVYFATQEQNVSGAWTGGELHWQGLNGSTGGWLAPDAPGRVLHSTAKSLFATDFGKTSDGLPLSYDRYDMATNAWHPVDTQWAGQTATYDARQPLAFDRDDRLYRARWNLNEAELEIITQSAAGGTAVVHRVALSADEASAPPGYRTLDVDGGAFALRLTGSASADGRIIVVGPEGVLHFDTGLGDHLLHVEIVRP